MTPTQLIKSFGYSFTAFDLRDNSPIPERVYDVIDNIMILNHRWVESIKSLKYWLPVIWQDRDWDYVFIFILLHHKLKGIDLSKTFIGGNREQKYIEIAVLLLDRIIEDDYSGGNWKSDINLKNQDIDYLFHILSKHIQKWWS